MEIKKFDRTSIAAMLVILMLIGVMTAIAIPYFYRPERALTALKFSPVILSPIKNSAVPVDAEDKEMIEKGALFIQVLDLINEYYYKEIDLDELVYPAIGEMVRNLGPYSQLVTAENKEEIANKKQFESKIIKTNFGKIGYFNIPSFWFRNPVAIGRDIEDFKHQKVKGIIIDLRGNEGGLISESIFVASYFLPPKTSFMTVKFRDSSEQKFQTSEDYDYYFETPIVIFANSSSASASEMFIGALRDHKRAIILGEKTFGKGLMQRMFELLDGSKLIFSIAEYYLPSGESIHNKGIKPHIEMDPTDDEAMMEKAEEVLSHWNYYKKLYLK